MPAQISNASVSKSDGSPFDLSGEYTVAKIRFGGIPQSFVISSHPHSSDSLLK